MTLRIDCRAKDPTSCPYHGNLILMAAAKEHLDFDGYAIARANLLKSLETDEFARAEQRHSDQGQQVDFETVATAQAAIADQLDEVGGDSLHIPVTHTYPTPELLPAPGLQYNSWVGSKYDPTLPISAVATQIKRDFSTAQKTGYLPKGLQIYAEKDVYSGGRAIRVKIIGVADADRYEPGPRGNDRPIPTARAKLIEARIENLVNAYNYNYRHDPFGLQSVDSHFHTDIHILDDRQQAVIATEKAQAATIRQAQKTAQMLTRQYDAHGYQALREQGFVRVGETRDGRPIGRIPGSSFLGIGTPNPIAPSGHTYKLYNLTAISEGTPGALEENLSLMTAMRIDAKFRKNRFIG